MLLTSSMDERDCAKQEIWENSIVPKPFVMHLKCYFLGLLYALLTFKWTVILSSSVILKERCLFWSSTKWRRWINQKSSEEFIKTLKRSNKWFRALIASVVVCFIKFINFLELDFLRIPNCNHFIIYVMITQRIRN